MLHYKLYYFPVRGRGDFIRYIFAYADIPYEEIVYTLDEWPSMKHKMPMGVVPVLELEDGRKLSQSLAIARYLATMHGLMSDDVWENAWGDQLVGAIEDIYPRYYFPYVKATFFEDNNAEKKKEAWEDMKKNKILPLFEKLQEFLGDKEWFCGKKLHWADLVIAELVDRIETVFEKGTITPFPKLHAHCKRVHELPAIKKYVDKRPQYSL